MQVRLQQQSSRHQPSVIRTVLLVLISTFSLLLAGCSFTSTPIDLLQQPAMTEQQTAVRNIVNRYLPVNSTLILPNQSGEQEAIRFIDLDNDHVDEVIVTYQTAQHKPEVLIFKQLVNEEWYLLARIQSSQAVELDMLQITDYDQNGSKQLLIGWIVDADNNGLLELYTLDQREQPNEIAHLDGSSYLKPIASYRYYMAAFNQAVGNDMSWNNGDITERTMQLAIVTRLDPNQDVDQFEETKQADLQYSLTVYGWSSEQGQLYPITTTTLDSEVNGYYNLQVGNIARARQGIIVEAGIGAHSSLSLMYLFTGDALQLLIPKLSPAGVNIAPVYSRDMDNDGVLELEWLVAAPSREQQSYAETLQISKWLQWDGRQTFHIIREQISDYSHNLTFDIPAAWSGQYTVARAEENGEQLFSLYYWDEEDQEKYLLATVYAVKQQEWNKWLADDKRKTAVQLSEVWRHNGNVYTFLFADPSEENNLPANKQSVYAKMKEELQEIEHFFGSLYEDGGI